jgi:hypothetical protein
LRQILLPFKSSTFQLATVFGGCSNLNLQNLPTKFETQIITHTIQTKQKLFYHKVKTVKGIIQVSGHSLKVAFLDV